MNLRQRRGVMFMAGAAVFLVVGMSSLSAYVRDIEAQVGPMVDVAVLDRDVEAFTPLTDDDIRVVEVPRRWAPDHAVSRPVEVLGFVTSTDLRAGTFLTEDIVTAAPQLEAGQREIAILIDAETGVAGKVRPGSRVDIVATFTDQATGRARSEVIVASARVLDIGDLQTESDDDGDDGFERGRVVPVTFALSVQDALVLTYAESFADQVRLALIGAPDERPVPEGERVYTQPEGEGP